MSCYNVIICQCIKFKESGPEFWASTIEAKFYFLLCSHVMNLVFQLNFQLRHVYNLFYFIFILKFNLLLQKTGGGEYHGFKTNC